jgi:rare lipoprotein A
VTLVETGRSVVVRINDRGPTTDRIIDLSRAAARELGLIEPGTGEVRIEILERGSP